MTCAASAHAVNVISVNPFPKLPYEATTVSQDETVKAAKAMRGDEVESEALAACRALADDETAPAALRKWAVWREFELLCYTGQEWDAVAAGQQWIQEHPGDASLPELRLLIAKTLANRRHDGFQPTLEDVRAGFEDLFAHHPSDEWAVIQGRLAFSKELLVSKHLDEAIYQADLARGYALERRITAESAGEDEQAHRAAVLVDEHIDPLLETLNLRAKAKEHPASLTPEELKRLGYDRSEDEAAIAVPELR
jgi:hypothetical protein